MMIRQRGLCGSGFFCSGLKELTLILNLVRGGLREVLKRGIEPVSHFWTEVVVASLCHILSGRVLFLLLMQKNPSPDTAPTSHLHSKSVQDERANARPGRKDEVILSR